MAGGHPTPSSQREVEAWVALGAGLGVAIGARLGNVLFWIVIGAVAGLASARLRTTREPGAIGEGSAA
jgi:hypothetical protein